MSSKAQIAVQALIIALFTALALILVRYFWPS
jgi:hypothetical protein